MSFDVEVRLNEGLHSHMALSRTVWERDRKQQQPGVEVPDALGTNTLAWASAGDGSGCLRRPSCRLIYTHVLKVAAGGAKSPLDALTGLTA